MTTNLTKVQSLVADIAKTAGALERWPGGFWTTPESPYTTKLFNGVAHRVPPQSYSFNTIEALIKRGILAITETDQTGWFPTRVQPT